MTTRPTPPRILYKYVGRSSHHIDIVKTLSIRFTQPDDLNDPFDCVPGILPPANIARFVDDTIRRNQAFIDLHAAREHVDQARAQMIQEYSTNPKALLERCERIVRSNMNTLGVLSLALRNDNMPLWAHYAATHSGFVIGMRTDGGPLTTRILDLLTEGELRPVIYHPSRVMVSCDPLELPVDVLFRKTSPWAYEEEWRVVRRLKSCDKVINDASGVAKIHMCSIEPSTVERIDLGMNSDDALSNSLMSATAPGTALQHVDIYRARLSHDGAGMVFDLIRKGV